LTKGDFTLFPDYRHKLINSAYKISVGQLEGMKLACREDIKINLKETGRQDAGWINLG
jgi:hypothetical protein